LRELGVAEYTVLWNAFPWHPHKPEDPLSNRAPTTAERALGLPVLERLLHLHSGAKLFAVGRTAEYSVQSIGRHAIPLRHPSMGGASLFRAQLAAALP